MKVSELMDPAGVRLYANIKEAADVLGILVELLPTAFLASSAPATAKRPTIRYARWA